MVYLKIDGNVNLLSYVFFSIFLFLVFGILYGKLYPRTSTDPFYRRTDPLDWKVKNCIDIETFREYYKKAMLPYYRLKLTFEDSKIKDKVIYLIAVYLLAHVFSFVPMYTFIFVVGNLLISDWLIESINSDGNNYEVLIKYKTCKNAIFNIDTEFVQNLIPKYTIE